MDPLPRAEGNPLRSPAQGRKGRPARLGPVSRPTGSPRRPHREAPVTPAPPPASLSAPPHWTACRHTQWEDAPVDELSPWVTLSREPPRRIVREKTTSHTGRGRLFLVHFSAPCRFNFHTVRTLVSPKRSEYGIIPLLRGTVMLLLSNRRKIRCYILICLRHSDIKAWKIYGEISNPDFGAI